MILTPCSYTGSVKFFHWNKGYGFLLCPTLGEDVFVGAHSVALPPGEYLHTGQVVTFDLGKDSDSRPRAENVRLLGQEPGAPADDARPYIEYPARRRRYLTTDMAAEDPPSGRAPRVRERAERLFVIPGADEV